MHSEQIVLQGLAPIVGARCRSLILGSMPGVQSLNAAEYYAHPRNALWWILSEWLGFDPDEPYRVRCQHLLDAGLGLWDVIGQCARAGSLDSAIEPSSVVVNDLMGLLDRQPHIQQILLNGGKAASLFKQHVAPSLTRLDRDIGVHVLPSTSPAYAAMSPEAKRDLWIKALS